MSFNPADPNKRKHPRKFDNKTLTPKTRKAKTHWQKLSFVCFLNNF